jgi:hypothetical protein
MLDSLGKKILPKVATYLEHKCLTIRKGYVGIFYANCKVAK